MMRRTPGLVKMNMHTFSNLSVLVIVQTWKERLDSVETEGEAGKIGSCLENGRVTMTLLSSINCERT